MGLVVRVVVWEEVSVGDAYISTCSPIVIIGPNKNAIIDNLVGLLSAEYRACVPHTTRAKRDDETDGQDYHFLTQARMLELAEHSMRAVTSYAVTHVKSLSNIICID